MVEMSKEEAIRIADQATEELPKLVQPEKVVLALVALYREVLRLEELCIDAHIRIRSIETDSHLLSGALQLLVENKIMPSSTELLAACKRAEMEVDEVNNMQLEDEYWQQVREEEKAGGA